MCTTLHGLSCLPSAHFVFLKGSCALERKEASLWDGVVHGKTPRRPNSHFWFVVHLDGGCNLLCAYMLIWPEEPCGRVFLPPHGARQILGLPTVCLDPVLCQLQEHELVSRAPYCPQPPMQDSGKILEGSLGLLSQGDRNALHISL